MKFHFDATEDFLIRQNEIKILLETAEEADEVRKETFFKLAVVSLVTKFQVFVENILKEFLYQIQSNDIPYKRLPLYMKFNSIKIDVGNNALVNLSKHNKFDEETKLKVAEYIKSISYIFDDEQYANKDLKLKTSFPLGKTGKSELLNLFKQINGDENFFINTTSDKKQIDIDQLDSLLLTRHLIVHQDRFNQTEKKIKEYQLYLFDVTEYCDSYLSDCLEEYGIKMEEKFIDAK